jgi:hypothetical protein
MCDPDGNYMTLHTKFSSGGPIEIFNTDYSGRTGRYVVRARGVESLQQLSRCVLLDDFSHRS